MKDLGFLPSSIFFLAFFFGPWFGKKKMDIVTLPVCDSSSRSKIPFGTKLPNE